MTRFTRCITQLLAVVAVLAGAGPARADVLLTYESVSPATNLQFSAGTRFFEVFPTGTMNFTAGAGAAEAGFGSTVRAYCVEILRQVAPAGQAVPYNVVPLTSIGAVAESSEGATKAAYLTELWGRYAAGATTDITAAAFALSVFKLLYDPVASRADFASGFIRFDLAAMPLDVTDIAGPGLAVTTASAYLASLSGDTSHFTANPLYANAELVGLDSGEFQDQMTVRAAPVIPAPAGVVLLGLGMAGLLGRRVSRRAS